MSGKPGALTRLGLCGVLVLAFGSRQILSQDDAADSEREEQAPATVYGPPERIIYIPFEKFSDAFQRPDASVVVPYAEYLQLLALKSGREGARQPVDAVISQAAYTATIEQDVARVRAELTVNVVGKPWVELPVKFGDAAVGAVSGTGENVLLRGTGDGTYALLFKARGEQKIVLDLTARVVSSPDGRQIDLDCPPSAMTSFEIRIPQADQDVEVRPRLVQQVQASAAGANETIVRASLGATAHIAAAWRSRATARPDMQLLANVNNRQRFHVADGLVHADAWLTFQVLRGSLQQVRIAVPPDHRILDVTASTRVQGWQAQEEEGRQVLTVDLLNAVENEVTVEVHTEQKLEGNAVSIGGQAAGGPSHGIHAFDVVRESGQIAVSHGGDLSLRVTDQSGLVRIEAAEVAKELQQADALAYKYYSPAFTLSVAVADVQPRVRVAQLADVVIGEDELTVSTNLTYTIDRAGIFDLRIRVPEGLEIDDVRSESLEEFRVVDGTVVAVLHERTEGTIQLAVDAHQPLEPDAAEVTLPLLEPLGTERETGLVRLFADDSVDVQTNESALEAARPAPVQPQEAKGAARVRAAWQFTHRPVAIPITMTRKPARLSATVATDVHVEPTRTRVTTLVDFDVEYAGLDRFRVSIPQEAIDTLQIEAVAVNPASPALKQQTPGDAADGWVPYTLVMQREVRGRQRFRIIYDLEPTAVVAAPLAAQNAEAPHTAANASTRPADARPQEPVAEVTAPDTDNAETPPPAGDVPPPSGKGSEDSAETPASVKPEDTRDGQDASSSTTPASDAAPADAPTERAADAVESATTSDGASASNAQPAATARGGETALPQFDPNRKRVAIRVLRALPSTSANNAETTPVARVTGEIRIEKEQSLTITASAAGGDVETIDVRELTTLPATGAFAFRYRTHPSEETIAVELTQARYDVQEVVETVVSRGLVEVMLGEDVTATYRCRYRVKSAERQRLKVELPKGLEVLSVLVDDAEVRLEPEPSSRGVSLWDTYFVKVARSAASDDAFTLTFQFLWAVNPPPFDHWLQGSIELPLPRIGERATAAVQQTRVVIWIPEKYALIGNPSGYTLLGETPWKEAVFGLKFPRPVLRDAGDDDWIGGASSALLEFPTTGRLPYRYSAVGGDQGRDLAITILWWNTVWYTVVVSSAIAVIGIVLLRTTWENKLGILLLLAFGGMLLGLKGEHVLAHAFSAARFGLMFLLGLWIVEAIFGRRRPVAAVSAASSAPPAKRTSSIADHVAVVPPPGVFEQFHSERPQ